MATFFLFGKYSAEALKGMAPERTARVMEVIQKFGGKVESIYALLGDFDLVFIVSLPGINEAMQASVALAKMTGIGFSTSPALPVADFDKLMAGL